MALTCGIHKRETSRVYCGDDQEENDPLSESEAATTGLKKLLALVSAGAEIVIESGHLPVAVIRPSLPPRRSISECIALLPEDSTAVMDADFAEDVEAAINSHREPLKYESP
jgi:hypothetical protein